MYGARRRSLPGSVSACLVANCPPSAIAGLFVDVALFLYHDVASRNTQFPDEGDSNMTKPSKNPVPEHAEDARVRGADLVIQCLEREGVDTIFAYPGGASMELHQALRHSPIRVILPRHEQGGGFAAAGYARATGRVGVAMATSGPGATNLVTAITDCYMDSIPTVFITGQVGQKFIGKNAFQETDIIGITRPIVKHSYLVLDVNDIPAVMAEAFYLANAGRPGPVVIDLPKDVQQSSCVPQFPETVDVRSYHVTKDPSDADVARVRRALANSARPCLYVGGGIISAGAHEELLAFAETNRIPVVTTLLGIGAFPDTHELSLKWLGMHGSYAANYAANQCDVLIGVGARFDDRVTGNVDTFATSAVIIHIDIDPSEINKNKRADVGVVCDARKMLARLNEKPLNGDWEGWVRQTQTWKRETPFSYKDSEHILPQLVVERLDALTGSSATIVTGVGQHQMWAGQFYNFQRPRQFHTSGGLGTMGFGLPAAMGVKAACPDETVILIDGDGSFQMNIQELGTVHCEGLGVKMVILNNQHLGMVAQWEDRFYGSHRGNTEMKSNFSERPYPHFTTVADGFLVPGRDVWAKDELDDAIREMLTTGGPYLLDVHVEYQEHVLPMIPPGGGYKDLILE